MSQREINIILKSKSDNSGYEAAKKGMGGVKKASADMIVNVQKIGNMFGELGSNIGGLIQNFLKGGIWGIAQSSIALVKEAVVALFDETEALQMSMERADRAAEKFAKNAREGMKKLADAHAETISMIDKELAARNRNIELLAKERGAVLELEKQKRIAAGQNAGDVNLDISRREKRMGAEDRDAKLSGVIDANRRKIKDIDAYIALRERKQAEYASNYTRLVREAKKEQGEQLEWARRMDDYKNGFNPAGNVIALWNEDQIDVHTKRVEHAFERADKAKGLVDENAAALKNLKEQRKAALQAIRDAKKERDIIAKEREASDIQIANEDGQRAKAAAAERAKAADERAKAEIKAAQDAARERERLDAELHKKRMADLRAEIAAQREAANPLRTVAAAAQSEFERAFAMYRDPSRAAAEIGEERDRADDLDRLHRDARRYGGKWRIDELSQLMAAGDAQGAQDRLAQWRKSATFTPEVEAMVRASAAEQTRTTAEDELRKLNDKTGELTSKLETLSQTRDAKLDGIERNTNQLAAKVDELLSVKG